MEKKSYDELAEIVLQNQADMYRMAYSILGNDADSQDAVSESIVRAFENWHKLKKKDRVRSWLTGILINVSRERLAREKRILLTEEPEKYVESEVFKEDELWPVIMELPHEIRIILTAYYYQNFTVREISRMLGIPEGTVKTRLSKGRKILTDIILNERGQAL